MKLKFGIALLGMIVMGRVATAESFALTPTDNGNGGAGGESTLAAQSASNLVKVRARGMGLTREEALKDAYRDAVERAVGLYVDAEQMMKNDELVNSQVLTQSNAYIERYDIVKESTENGLCKIQILATVKKRALVQKISGFMPVQNVSLGSSLQNLHATLISKEKRGEDGAALLKNALAGVDPIAMLCKPGIRPETCQKCEQIEDGVSHFKGGKISEGQIGLSYIFDVKIDRRKYFDEFVPKLKQVLDQISVEPPCRFRVSALKEQTNDSRLHYMREYLLGGNKRNTCCDIDNRSSEFFYDPLVVFSGSIRGRSYSWKRFFSGSYFFDSVGNLEEVGLNGGALDRFGMGRCVGGELILVTELNEKGQNGYAVRYVLDRESSVCLNDWLNACGCYSDRMEARGDGNKSEFVTYNIVFKDKNDDEISVFPWQVQRNVLVNVCAKEYSRHDEKNRAVFYISPFVGGIGGCVFQWRDFVFDKDDLAKIASVSIERIDD